MKTKGNYLLYKHLYDWYEIYHRNLPWRETEDGYRIWVSEVILQQTRVAQGMDYYLRFVDRWPCVEALSEASEADVLREWQGLGYYSRARNLHKAAQMIVANGWSPFPTRFEDVLSLPGVGEYTAGAIMSFAHNAPYAAMDGNVYRVLSRLLDIDEAFDSSVGKKLFRSEMNLLLDSEHPRLFNSAIMELGALWCTPILDDHCEHCPLQRFCLGYQRGTAAMLPIRKPRPVLRDRWLHYTIYLCRIDNELHTLIHQRTAQDIWKHLYEFILNEYDNEEQWLDADTSQSSITTTHILSHQRLHARFTIQPVDTLPTIPNSMCIRWSELDQYALSRLTLKVLEQMGSII